ncbi:MAG: error-prone DNA polymerase [Bowdeniella nasicola]|nr:error-prone DNA polymerase [Bowdeniella nasicola]
MTEPRYAELHSHSAYTFLRGANQPAELVHRAAQEGYSALALTDVDGLYGVVQHARAAADVGLPTVIGADVTYTMADLEGTQASSTFQYATEKKARSAHAVARGAQADAGQVESDAARLVVVARGTEDYAHLSRTLAAAHLAAGDENDGRQRPVRTNLADLAAGGEFLVLTGSRYTGAVPRSLLAGEPARATRHLDALISHFGRESVAVQISAHALPDDSHLHDALADLAAAAGVPLVAAGDVYCARPEDFALYTALHATHRIESLDAADPYLPPSAPYLRKRSDLARLYQRHPRALETADQLGRECAFDLALIAPQLPPHPVPEGYTEASWLRELTARGARERYGEPGAERVPGAYAMLNHELAIIEQLGFPGYFLIVHEIVQFCRSRGILCQGRGSAANSAVCYALGITAVDAVTHRLLFERFLSPGRSGPPDIDVDIESNRREEVIQFVYRRYGRTHAALVANVISYRPRSAVRDAARALGMSAGAADAMTKRLERYRSLEPGVLPEPVEHLAEQFLRLPRHLGIHPGGMVLCDRPIVDVCPVQWAAMPGRSIVQWDKDDCADAGLVKFDLLGLGMLTALRHAFDTLRRLGVHHDGRPIDLHDIPQEDTAVYDLLCAADTIGVFQVESRAQQQNLPRMAPRCFYDIVIEVALVRPGPIQGGSVNPYIRRRLGHEPVTYPHPSVEGALKKTLGVPIFQEQLMQIAVDAAGFTPAEADQLRKAMGAKRSKERMAALRGRLLEGMAARGIPAKVREEIYTELQAFSSFGFPESHSFSFAYLVYASAYLKVHHPEAFYAGLLASQPMGFYSPNSLVADARRHGVCVLPADIDSSDVEAAVVEAAPAPTRPDEYDPDVAHLVHPDPRLAVRLGLAPVRGIGEASAQRIVKARESQEFHDVTDLAARARLTTRQIENLATAGALTRFGTRRQMLWSAAAAGAAAGQTHRVGDHTYIQEPLPGIDVPGDLPHLPHLEESERARLDLWATGLSTTEHPVSFIRERLYAAGVRSVSAMKQCPDGTRVRVAGLVTHRQRPATASGITFLALEDETGMANVVCSPGLWARYRAVARGSAALVVRGIVQASDGAYALRADRIDRLDLPVPSMSRDFR